MAVLTVLATLGLGVVIGIAIDRRLLQPRGDSRANRGGGRGGSPFGVITEPVDTASRNRMRGRIVRRITDDLDLSPAQASAVDAIFARRELQLDSLRAHVGPQLDSLRDQMRAAMDSVLTPEQRAKSAAARRRMDERRRAAEGRDGAGRRGD
jgi:hypothetical protein